MRACVRVCVYISTVRMCLVGHHNCCIQYKCTLVLFLVGTSYENNSLFRRSVSYLQIRVRMKVTSDSCDMYVFIFQSDGVC